MTREVPRRPASSRTPTSRPRRIAGRGSGVVSPSEVETESTPQETDEAADLADTVDEVETAEPVETEQTQETPETEIPETETPASDAEDPQRDLGSLFASRRTTAVLVVVAAVLAMVAAGLGIWLWQHDEDPAPVSKPTEGEIAVPEGRPVLLSAADAQEAVAAGAEAASTIVATSYQDYDEQVEEAAALMTDEFAEEYRQTAEDVKQKILDSKTEVQVTIVAQGVVRANTSEVQGLLFLNQYSSKDGGETTYTPYRALVTVVHTDSGWLVSGLDTQ